MTCHPEASTKTLLAAALALLAAGCGDGMDVQLGTKREFPPLPEGGTGDGGVGDASDAADVMTPDSTSGCPNGAEIPGPLLGLLDDRVGFGRQATGGKDGCLYRVTEATDQVPPNPGTLRYGLESPDPLWIIFDDTVASIELTDNLRPLSNKTIDGREANVVVGKFGIEIAGQQNFVISNVRFEGDPDAEGTADAITLRQGTHTVWIDHCSFSAYRDGLLDVIDGATKVTISWSHFHDQEKVMLLGSENDSDVGRNMQITLHHNWFDHTYTYHPRARWGQVHMFNNLIEAWGTYGIGPTLDVRVISEANIYLADPMHVADAIRTSNIEDEAASRAVWSENDSFRGGADYANPTDLTRAAVFEPRDLYPYTPLPAKDDDSLLEAIKLGSGAR